MNVQSPSRETVLALLLVGALTLAPMTGMAVVRGSPDLETAAPDNLVTPGEATEFSVTLANKGNLAAGAGAKQNTEVTTARGVDVKLKDGDAPVTIENEKAYLGTLPADESAELPFDIVVDEDAHTGTYEMELEVDYEYTSSVSENSGGRNFATNSRSFDVELKVVDRATFEVVDVETDVKVGSSGTVSVRMENTGSEAATDAKVELSSDSEEFSFSGTSAAGRFVDHWSAGEIRTIDFQTTASSEAAVQEYAFEATTTFEDSDGFSQEAAPITLGVYPLPEQRFSVVEADSDLAVGDSGTINLTMSNDGAVAVNDATVKLQSQSPDVVFGESDSATRFVGAWVPNTTRTVEFDADATGEADTRSYALSATVSYDDVDDDPHTAKSVSLGVTPEPETSFALSDVSSDLRVGKERTIQGTVTNDGDTTTEDVVLTFATEAENVHPTDREYAIGDLAPGESTDFAYSVEISDAADSGPRQFTLVAEYRASEGDPRTSDDLLTRQNVREKSDVFALEVTAGTVQNGGSGAYTVEVTNAGEETVSDVTAKLYANSPISVSDDEAFIQELAPGESTKLTFGVGASAALAKTYPLKLDFEYEDEDGDVLISDTYRAPIDVSDGGGGGLPFTLLGIAGLAVVGGVGAYVRFR